MGKLMEKIFAKISFYYLGKGLNILAKHDDDVLDRLAIVPTGSVISLSILGQNEKLALMKTDNGFAVSKENNVDFQITFKFFDSLPSIVFGQKSVTECYLNNEFFVAGDLRYAVAIVYAIEQLMAYLLPKKRYQKVYGRMPKYKMKKIKMLGKLLFARRAMK